MDIFRMRCFISVAECQSLSKAAREQFVTQPAMSAQMSTLEKELDAQLLMRGRSITLTPAGQVALERFRAIVDDYDAARRAVSLAESETRGLIKMGFHGPVSWAGVPAMVRAFRAEHSDMEIDMIIDTWNNLMHMLEAGALDVAFMELSELEGQTQITAKPLFEEDAHVVVPPEHPLAERESVSVQDIVDEPLMLYDLNTSPRFFTHLYNSFRRAGVKTEHIIRGNHHEATIALVLAGCGITCMPYTFCREMPGIRHAPFSDLTTHMRYGIAWNRMHLTAAASMFVSFAETWNLPGPTSKMVR